MSPMAIGFYGAFPVMFCVVFALAIFIIGGTIVQNLKQNCTLHRLICVRNRVRR